MNCRRRSLAATATLGLFLHACDSPAPHRDAANGPPAITLRDSRHAEVWSVCQPPVMELAASPAEGWFLNGVRGAVRMPDGGLAVANGGENQVLFFDTSGRLKSAVGRQGSGPGEFRWLYAMWPGAGDTVVAFDRSHRRVTRLTADGVAGTAPVTPATGGFVVIGAGMFSNGDVLGFTQIRAPGPEVVGKVTPDRELFASNDTVARSLGVFEGIELYLGHSPDGGPLLLFGEAPFGVWTRFAVENDTVWTFHNRDYAFEARDREGRTLARYSRDWSPRRVTEQDRKRHIEIWAREYPDEKTWPERRRMFETVDYPDEMAAYRNALVGRGTGLIWIEPYESWDSATQHWVAYGRDGRQRASLDLPFDNEVMEIGDGYVVAKARRDDGSEVVRVFGLDASCGGM